MAGSRDTANTETTNYEISNTTTTTVKEPGEVKKLAVAVAVDGKWTPAADGKGEPTYAPRSAEEIAQIKSLVAAAAGEAAVHFLDDQSRERQLTVAPEHHE